jgi:hypothetical protein
MDSIKFVNFYFASLECYSQAEGGCYFVYLKPAASFPLKYFTNGSSNAQHLDKDKIAEVGESLGLVLEHTEIECGTNDDGSPEMRKVRGIRSSAPEANAVYYLEEKPFESETTEWPQYE